MALQSRFFEFSNEEIEGLLKNSGPAKTKKATIFGIVHVHTSKFLTNVFKNRFKFLVHTANQSLINIAWWSKFSAAIFEYTIFTLLATNLNFERFFNCLNFYPRSVVVSSLFNKYFREKLRIHNESCPEEGFPLKSKIS